MSLATRCTSCGTIFKVVQDQLKVSEGWVRCGRCHQVFNALEGLFDLDRDPPPQRRSEPSSRSPASSESGPGATAATPSVAARESLTAPTSTSPNDLHGPDEAPDHAASTVHSPASTSTASQAPVEPNRPAEWAEVPATHEDDALDSRWLVRPARDGRSARERHARHDPDSDFTDARFPLDAALDEFADSDAADERDSAPRPMPPIPQPRPDTTMLGRRKAGAPQGGSETPGFLKQARRQAQWRHPVVRATLSVTALALLALLLLQASVAFRDWIVAYRPDTAHLVAGLCRAAGCEIQPLKRMDQLSVDSVTLVRAPSAGASTSAYRLTVGIHNGAGVPLAVPHVELSLTDANGQLVSRRLLGPGDLAVRAATMPPRTSTPVHAQLLTDGPRIAGYTVELFYP